MLVIIKNAPDTSEGRRGMQIARDAGADVVLLQNGVTFSRQVEEFPQKAYVLEDDLKLRGFSEAEVAGRIIGYPEFVDLMTSGDTVVGMF